MPNLSRDGLFEALDDFGVDMSATGLVVAQVVSPVISLVDLSLNYKPAVRAKLFGRFQPPASVGNVGGFQLQAGFGGMWVLSVSNQGTTTCLLWVDANPAGFTGNLVAGSFSIFGDSPGEVRVGGSADDFFGGAVGSNRSGTKIGLPTTGYVLRVDNVPTIFPFFVPGQMWLNCMGLAVNVGLDLSVALQMPASNAGRLP